MPAPKVNSLPAGVLSGHVGEIPLPPPFSAQQLIGQLVQVQDGAGNHYLVSETGSHYLLHRRTNPAANGHARNAVHPVSVAVPNPGDV